MAFDPQTSKTLVLKKEEVFRVAQDYRRLLAKIDAPVLRSKSRETVGMYHAQINAIRSLMELLMGKDAWERTLVVSSWEGPNYLDMEREARQIPLDAEVLRLPWEV